MALQGNIEFFKFEQTGTETVEVEVPMDIPAEHPQYENRGQTISMEQPILEEVKDEEKSFDNVYLIIQSCGFTQHKESEADKMWYLSIIYAVYESKEARDNLEPALQINDFTNMEKIDIDSDEFNNDNIVIFAYNKLKSIDSFSNMTDV